MIEHGEKPLSEAQKKEIFLALVETQDRETSVAQSRKVVAEQFGVSEQRVKQIEREGLDGNWPPLGEGDGETAMTADQTAALREHLLFLLRGGGAHLDFDKAIAELPSELRGQKPVGSPHTPWRLLEHLRIAQWDILEFSRNPRHVSPSFPDGYWPQGDAPPDTDAWDHSVAAFRSDLRAMQDLTADPRTDLFAPLPHGDGQTILREALLVADHNAYHLGQLVMVRRLLGAWPEES